jgi:hypothetical protein
MKSVIFYFQNGLKPIWVWLHSFCMEDFLQNAFFEMNGMSNIIWGCWRETWGSVPFVKSGYKDELCVNRWMLFPVFPIPADALGKTWFIF